MRCVSIKGLSLSYDGTNDVLSGVDLSIDSDDFIGIIGPNGGGKTSLVKALMGLVSYRGVVEFSDDVKSGNLLKIGYLPQINNFDYTFPISVFDVVMSGLQKPGFLLRHTKHDKTKALELMEKTGISSLAEKQIGEISGGQMQRALLCRAIISDPKLLILDEPANFVDNKFEKELYSILQELNKQMAIVMVSHDLGTITTVVKSIVCVNKYVHRHNSNTITSEQLLNYDCPIQLVSHGEVPHTVLESHD